MKNGAKSFVKNVEKVSLLASRNCVSSVERQWIFVKNLKCPSGIGEGRIVQSARIQFANSTPFPLCNAVSSTMAIRYRRGAVIVSSVKVRYLQFECPSGIGEVV